jgi:hypothetical protein
MRKLYLIAGLAILFVQVGRSQTITPEALNFTQLANFEKAHPELYKRCATCKEKENDAEWKELYNDMPIPAGAIIKKQLADNSTAARPDIPSTPLSASPPPTKSFLGHVDPGEGIPPDTHGAVGLNHVITATNDFLIVHNKTTGAEVSRISISAFTGVSTSCDPYIKFDPSSGRWFYSAINCEGSNGNTMAVLISASGDPTAGWSRYTFTPGNSYFLDHPYLGFNEKWLVISGRRFPDLASFAGPVLFVLDKANLLAGGALSFGVNAQRIEKSSADGDSPLPVTVYGNNPSPGTFYILQSWNGSASAIRLSTVTGNIPNATWNSASAVFPVGGAAWTDQTGAVAEQLGESRRTATNDSRISTGVMVNGNIWCAHHIGISANNVAVQWWQLNGTPGSSFGNIMQRGRIGAGLPNNYRFFPGIAVNEFEDVIIGYTFSSNISRLSSAYSFRSNLTPLNTTDDEYIYKVGLSTYFKDFGGTRSRWGDYSHSALDPTDGSIWTIQEYADQRVGSADNDSRYGVWWAQVSPASTLLKTDASIAAVAEPNSGLLCKVPIEPKITVRNLGTDTLKTVQVGIILDGIASGPLNTFSNLSIATFNSSSLLSLTPSLNVAPGPHVLQIFTINPNSTQDLRTSNDTSTINFTVAPTLNLPYTEDFTSSNFPPANGSAITNPDGGFTWERTTAAGRPAAPSMKMQLFDYGPDLEGQRDIYRTPKINTSILDSLAISFNVAYRQYPGVSDSLNILYSPDCGLSWFPAGYSKGGRELSTVAGTTENNFVPASPSEWRTEKIILRDFCARNLNNVMIGFEAVNEYGNNLYIDSIDIAGFNSVSTNAILKSVSQPLPVICAGNTYTPQVSFGNAGLDTINNLKIKYVLDNGPDTITTNWSGKLGRCDSVTITLLQGNAAVGTHILTVFTSEPNGVNDQSAANDTLRKTFTVFSEVASATPVFEGFEDSKFPTDNWGVQNVNGGTTYERSTSAAKTGTASMKMNNPNAANFNNAVDYFITPLVANSISFDSMFVDFDLSYKPGPQYPGSTVFPLDTLEILATSDCGKTFTSVWKKWGNELQTVNDPSYSNTDIFTPAVKAEWKSIRLYLTPFVGANNFQLYFATKGNKQNNLWIDNVNISSLTLPQRLKDQGYLVYPNPFSNSFVIHHYAVDPPTSLQSVQVFNSAGQQVWLKEYKGNADRKIYVDLSNNSRGLYILKMLYTNKTVVERIIKN